jgi:hypothetical protein
LTDTTNHFSIGVDNTNGRWPGLPQTWSYSSLRDATECPRRWMLSRAAYPDLWSQWGYPPRPSLPALIGDVIHGVLEVLLRSFRAQGCASLADPCAVGVLRDLGGYTKLVEQGIEGQLDKLAENPRVGSRLPQLRTALRVKVPEIRQRVQAVIARTPFQSTGNGPTGGDTAQRGPLAPGFHPEVELRAPELRMAGRADLLHIDQDGCEITDYKTGSPDPHHADQLRLYALLWNRDFEANPESLPVRQLVIAYPSKDVVVEPPTAVELDLLASATVAEIKAAETALLERPPPAYPEPTVCRFCGVRQLCEDYWMQLPTLPASSQLGGDPDWFDFEGTVIERNGSRSWLVAAASGKPTLLLRTMSEAVPFKVGDHLRLLDLHRDIDPESTLPIGTLSHTSEVFTVDRPTNQ